MGVGEGMRVGSICLWGVCFSSPRCLGAKKTKASPSPSTRENHLVPHTRAQWRMGHGPGAQKGQRYYMGATEGKRRSRVQEYLSSTSPQTALTKPEGTAGWPNPVEATRWQEKPNNLQGPTCPSTPPSATSSTTFLLSAAHLSLQLLVTGA